MYIQYMYIHNYVYIYNICIYMYINIYILCVYFCVSDVYPSSLMKCMKQSDLRSVRSRIHYCLLS